MRQQRSKVVDSRRRSPRSKRSKEVHLDVILDIKDSARWHVVKDKSGNETDVDLVHWFIILAEKFLGINQKPSLEFDNEKDDKGRDGSDLLPMTTGQQTSPAKVETSRTKASRKEPAARRSRQRANDKEKRTASVRRVAKRSGQDSIVEGAIGSKSSLERPADKDDKGGSSDKITTGTSIRSKSSLKRQNGDGKNGDDDNFAADNSVGSKSTLEKLNEKDTDGNINEDDVNQKTSAAAVANDNRHESKAGDACEPSTKRRQSSSASRRRTVARGKTKVTNAKRILRERPSTVSTNRKSSRLSLMKPMKEDAEEEHESEEESSSSPSPSPTANSKQKSRSTPNKRKQPEMSPPPPTESSHSPLPSTEQTEGSRSPLPPTEDSSSAAVKSQLTCSLCPKTFKRKTALERHLQAHDGANGQFPCKECGKVYRSQSSLWTHRQRIHIRKLECEVCQRKFGLANQLATHMKTHSTEKPHGCDRCDAFFKTPQDLRAHMETHNEDAPYLCHDCGASFKRRDGLKHHIRRHKGPDKSLFCELCKKSFKSVDSLRSHEELHKNTDEGQAPFKCDLCDNAYTTLKTLQGHMNRHRMETDLQCKVCKKLFKFKHHLVRHEAVHLEKKPFSCPQCDRGFTQRSNMVIHLRTHTGEKPYKCDVCGETFRQNVSMKNHKQKIHGIDIQKQSPSSQRMGRPAKPESEKKRRKKEETADSGNETVQGPASAMDTCIDNQNPEQERLVPRVGKQKQSEHEHLSNSNQPVVGTEEQTQKQQEEKKTVEEPIESEPQGEKPQGRMQHPKDPQSESDSPQSSESDNDNSQTGSENSSESLPGRPLGQGNITTATLYSHYKMSTALQDGSSSLPPPLINKVNPGSSSASPSVVSHSQPAPAPAPQLQTEPPPVPPQQYLPKNPQHLQAPYDFDAETSHDVRTIQSPSSLTHSLPQSPQTSAYQSFRSPSVASSPTFQQPATTTYTSFTSPSPIDHAPPQYTGFGASQTMTSLAGLGQSLPTYYGQDARSVPPSVGMFPSHLAPVSSPSPSMYPSSNTTYTGYRSYMPQPQHPVLNPYLTPSLTPSQVQHQTMASAPGMMRYQSHQDGTSLVNSSGKPWFSSGVDPSNQQAALALASMHLPGATGAQAQVRMPYMGYTNAPVQYQLPTDSNMHGNNTWGH